MVNYNDECNLQLKESMYQTICSLDHPKLKSMSELDIQRQMNIAIKMIIKYVNNPNYNVYEKHSDEIIEYTIHLVESRDTRDYNSVSQGSMSVSYNQVEDIPTYIKASLPHYAGLF